VEATLPCLITVEKDNFFGRLPNLEAYLASKTAAITTYTENNIDGLDLQKIGAYIVDMRSFDGCKTLPLITSIKTTTFTLNLIKNEPTNQPSMPIRSNPLLSGFLLFHYSHLWLQLFLYL
jgi:hypothetical protein